MKKLTTILMLFCMCLFTVHCSAVTDIYKSTLYKSTFYASSYTPPVGSTPVLFFSDLISGPATGNTDTSLGQSSGVHGSIVTVWGKNLGSSQGTSTITCNGVVAPYVYMWGNNTFPLELNTKRGWQMISFQVASTATSGAGTIYATVGGINTNTLAFTVRTGSIY